MNSDCYHRFRIILLVSLIAFACQFTVSCNQKTNETAVSNADTVKPDENRFTPVKLTADGDLDEPMNFEVLTGGCISMKGKVY